MRNEKILLIGCEKGQLLTFDIGPNPQVPQIMKNSIILNEDIAFFLKLSDETLICSHGPYLNIL